MDEMEKAEKCAQIIKCQHDGKDSKCPSQQQARAGPNARLIPVFGIDNVFTNTTGNKRKFVEITQKLMWKAMKMRNQNDNDNWIDLCHQATTFFNEYLALSGVGTIRIAELIQYIVLKQSLCYLFDHAEQALAANETQFDEIRYIGHRINELWIKSKGSDNVELPDWRNEQKLHAALRRVTGIGEDQPENEAASLSGKKNPMNLLLPAYETMWRVVLRCFLEVCCRNAPHASDWIAIVQEYVKELRDKECKPNRAFQKNTTTCSAVRPTEIVKEALRLYPPTRHVHRCFNGEEVTANIEECHRSKILAGYDPLVFHPDRWKAIFPELRDNYSLEAVRMEEGGPFLPYKKTKDGLRQAEESLGYMPFAYFCAADHATTKEFASKMIGMVIGVLCEGLGGKWEVDNALGYLEPGAPLDSDRAAYEDLKLRRKAC